MNIGDQEAVRFVPVDRGQQAFKQEMALVLDEAAPVEQPAEVQVCNVQEFQGKSPSFAVRAAPRGRGRGPPVLLHFSENRPAALFRKRKSWYNGREPPALRRKTPYTV